MGTLKQQAVLLQARGVDIQKASYSDQIDYALDVSEFLIGMADALDALTVRVDRLTAYADEDDGGVI
jgi:hypothetical protein